MKAGKSDKGDTPDFEPIIDSMRRLSPQSKELVAPLVRQLAEREGIGVAAAKAREFLPPAEGIGQWVAKRRSERRSERTIAMYRYLAEKFLGVNTTLTKGL